MSSPSGRLPENDEAIEATAAAWLVQRDEGFTPAQAAEFARWCDASPRHAAAIAELEETCDILGRIPELSAHPKTTDTFANLAREARAAPAAAPAPAARAMILPFPRAFKIAVALAACFVLVAAAWWLRTDRPAELGQTYATSVGGYQRIALPDGSLLELNGASEARVHFTATAREITLARGEAHFTVAKNPARPFVVHANRVAVRAVGTAFNVRLESQQVEVVVTEGRVQLTRPAEPASRASDLAAGQRAFVPFAGAALPQITTLDPLALGASTAWQSPRLVFQNTPLSEVVAQFNRHNRVQLSIADPALGTRPVGGTFLAGNVETFVQLLHDSGDVAIERPAPDRIVLRKTP